MRVLFIISGADTAFWLSEVTHPYWHLTERDVEVDFASPKGGKVVYDPYSDPYFAHSTEANDLVSKGFLSDKALVAKLEKTSNSKMWIWTATMRSTLPADGVRPSISIRTTTWRERSSTSGQMTRWSAPYATARSPSGIFPIVFVAAGLPAIRLRAIKNYSV